MASRGGEDNAKRAASQGENQAFCEQLPDQAGASCAECLTDGEFAHARGGTGEEKICNVGAGDEKDETYDGHEHFERAREAIAESRKAGGHGCQFQMSFVELEEIFPGEGSRGETAKDLLEEEISVGGRLRERHARFDPRHQM